MDSTGKVILWWHDFFGCVVLAISHGVFRNETDKKPIIFVFDLQKQKKKSLEQMIGYIGQQRKELLGHELIFKFELQHSVNEGTATSPHTSQGSTVLKYLSLTVTLSPTIPQRDLQAFTVRNKCILQRIIRHSGSLLEIEFGLTVTPRDSKMHWGPPGKTESSGSQVFSEFS